MSAPAISVIMPCHNRAHDLTRVLKAYDAQEGDGAVRDRRRRRRLARRHHRRCCARTALPRIRPALRASRQSAAGRPAPRNRALELVRGAARAVRRRRHRAAPRPGRAPPRAPTPAAPDDRQRRPRPRRLAARPAAQHADGAHRRRRRATVLLSLPARRRRVRLPPLLHLERLDQDGAGARPPASRFDTAFPFAAMEDAEFAYRLEAHGLRIRYRAELVGLSLSLPHHLELRRATVPRRAMAALFATKHPTTGHRPARDADPPARRPAAGGGRRSRPPPAPRCRRRSSSTS